MCCQLHSERTQFVVFLVDFLARRALLVAVVDTLDLWQLPIGQGVGHEACLSGAFSLGVVHLSPGLDAVVHCYWLVDLLVKSGLLRLKLVLDQLDGSRGYLTLGCLLAILGEAKLDLQWTFAGATTTDHHIPLLAAIDTGESSRLEDHTDVTLEALCLSLLLLAFLAL